MSRYGYYDFGGYETVAEKIAKAKKQLAKLKKKYPDISPVEIKGRSIAESWWGKAWIKNLQTYADYSNRIGRGRSYVKNGFVLDLKISEGKVVGKVCGSRSTPYEVEVNIDPMAEKNVKKMTGLCNKKVDGLEDLVGGKFPKELEALFVEPEYGLFPRSNEIDFACSCPDGAWMCKHVSAVLYAVAAKFDMDPCLFFLLRNIDFKLFLSKTVEEKMDMMLKNAGKKTNRIIEEDISGLFDL